MNTNRPHSKYVRIENKSMMFMLMFHWNSSTPGTISDWAMHNDSMYRFATEHFNGEASWKKLDSIHIDFVT